MVSSRTATALVGAAVSLAVTFVAWYYFGTPFVFFVVPFVPFLFRRRTRSDRRRADGRAGPRPGAPGAEIDGTWECPRCGFRTRNEEYTHCPRDGTPLRPANP